MNLKNNIFKNIKIEPKLALFVLQNRGTHKLCLFEIKILMTEFQFRFSDHSSIVILFYFQSDTPVWTIIFLFY